MNDKLLTIQEAADYFGVSTRTLRRWEERGYLAAHRTLGNQRRYSLQQLESLFKGKPQKDALTSNILIDETYNNNKPFEQTSLQTTPLQPTQNTPANDPIFQNDFQSKRSLAFATIGAAVLVILFAGLISLNGYAFLDGKTGINGFLTGSKKQASSQSVLAAQDATPNYILNVNVPAIFGKKVTFLDAFEIKNSLTVGNTANLNGGIRTNNKDIDAGTGKITASNIIYSLLAGSNIAISGDPQHPTISSTATSQGNITSVQGQTGDISFSGGNGIGLNGLQINNTGVLSLQGQTGDLQFTGGSGISLANFTISNSDPGSAQKFYGTFNAGGTAISAGANADTFTFAAGSGISLTGDAATKTLTITSNANGTLSGLATNGVLYATNASNATTVAPGTNGYVLISNGAGSPPSWAPPGTALGFVNFDILASGTNTQANMVVGTGASLGYTGTGSINASTLQNATWVAPGAIGSSTPNTGAFTSLSANTINGLIVTANGSNTLTIAAGKTFTVNNTLTLSGTDGTTFSFPSASDTLVGRNSTDTLTNKTIAAGSNTISGLTNANLSGSAGITNANLANSSLTVTAGTGLSGGGSVALGGSVTLNNAGVTSAIAGTGISIDQATGNITFSNSGVTSLTGTTNQVNVSAATGGVIVSLPQNIHSGASPTFAGLTLSGLTNNGGILYTNGSGTFAQTSVGSSGQCLTSSGGGAPSWSACAASNYWQVNNGALSPFTNSLDLLIGGTATASAKFAFINTIGGGVPTASISGTTTNVATYITGNGNFSTTNAQTLQVGSASSGNISLLPGGTNALTALTNGNVGIGTSLPNAKLQIINSNANQPILRLVEDPSQNTNPFVIEDSTNSPIFTVSQFGGVIISNGLTVDRYVGIGTSGSSGTQLRIQSITQNDVGFDTTGTNNQIANLANFNPSFGFTGAWFDESANLRIGHNAPDTGKFNVTGADTGHALGIFDETGDQAILTGSASGTTKFTFDRSGNLNLSGTYYANGVAGLTQGSASCVTTTNGIVTGFGTCQLGSEQWIVNSGSIYTGIPSLDLLLGGTSTASAKFGFLNNAGGTPTASISANSGNNATFLSGAGVLGTTNAQTLTLGNASTGNVVIDAGSGLITLSDYTVVAGSLNLATGNAFQINGTSVLNGTTLGTGVTTSSLTTVGALASGSIANGFGTIATGNTITGTTLNGTTGINTGGGAGTQRIDASGNLANIGTITASGVVQFSNYTTNGGLLYTNGSGTVAQTAAGTSAQCLLGGTTPTWGTCALGTNYWQSNNGTVSPFSNTLDLLVGGTSTASAKFAFINNAAGTPTASISGNLTLNSAGVVQTTRNQTLTIGGNTTGDILLQPRNSLGFVGINTNPSAVLTAKAGGATDSLLKLIDSSNNPNFTVNNNGWTLLQPSTDGGAFDIKDSSGNFHKFAVSTTFGAVGINTFPFTSTAADPSLAIITNATDQVGLRVQGLNGSQTADLLQLQTSTPTSVLTVSATGAFLSQNASNSTAAFAIKNAGGSSLFIADTTNQRIGIGATPTAGKFNVTGADTGKALAIFNETGDQDIFAASKSGTTKLVVKSNGDLLVGTDATSTFGGFQGRVGNFAATGSVQAGILNDRPSIVMMPGAGGTSLGYLQWYDTFGNSYASLTGMSEGGLSLFGGGLGIGVTATGNKLATLDIRGIQSGTLPIASFSGSTSFAGTVVDQSGTGDLFTASNSGASKFTILNNGNIQLNNYTANGGILYTNASGVLSQTPVGSLGQCLTSNGGGAPTWSACSGGTNLWQFNNGAVSPFSNTADLLIGNTATTSAKFAFMNVNSGTPTASISGTTANVATYLDGNGNLGTTKKTTLALGTSSTGNVILAPGGSTALTALANGNVTVAGTFGASNFSGSSTGTNTGDVSLSGQNYLSLAGQTITANAINLSGTNVTSTLGVGNGGTGTATAFTTGSLVFAGASGIYAQDNANFFYDATNHRLGIGTAAPVASLDVRGTSGTRPVASISGQTSSASMIIDQSGLGDLFTASKSGATKFVIDNAGNVGIGTGSPTNLLTIQPTIAGQDALQVNRVGLTSPAVTLRSYANGGQIVGWDSGNQNFLLNASGNSYIAGGGLGIGTYGATFTAALNVFSDPNVIVNSGTVSVASFSAQTAKAIAIVDQTGVGDIFTASKSGATKFVISNNGNIQFAGTSNFLNTLATAATAARTYTLPDATGTICLQGSGSCGFALGQNYWQVNNGALSPFTNTVDLLLGATATTSAKFAFTGVNSGTPTASISGTTANVATYLDGNGNLGTTKKTTLALGTSSTGNVILAPGGSTALTAFANGNVTVAGTFGASNFAGSSTGTNTGDISLSGENYLSLAGQTITANAINLSGTNVTSTLGVGNGGTGTATAFTQGSLVFAGASGIYSQNNANLFFDNTNRRLGIGTANPFTSLDVRATSGTLAVASVSGTTSFATAIIDQSGTGDIFAASKSGATKFVINNAGNVGINTANAYEALTVNGGAGIGTTFDRVGAALSVRTTNTSDQYVAEYFGQNASFAGFLVAAEANNAKPFLQFADNAGSGCCSVTADWTLTSENSVFNFRPGNAVATPIFSLTNNGSIGINASTQLATLDVRGLIGTSPIASLSGSTAMASQVVDQSGVGDIFTASKSGATKFVIKNNGDIALAGNQVIDTLTNGTLGIGTANATTLTLGRSGQSIALPGYSNCGTLSTSGTTLTCNTASNYWQLQNGAISPFSATADLLIGGNATASAKFAFINTIGGGTPTASISGSVAGVATSFDGNGNIGTTKATTLTLGTASTGNVSLAPAGTAVLTANSNGFVGIGNTNPQEKLEVSGAIRLDNQLNFSNATFGQVQTLVGNATLDFKTAVGTGAITFTPNATEAMRIASNGTVGIGTNGGVSNATLDIRGVSGTLPIASISGTTARASMIIDQSGLGDLFTASKSGATKFAILNNGNLQFSGTSNFLNTLATAATAARTYTLPDASGTICLNTGTGCPTGLTNYWQLQNGAISPFSATADLLIGSTASTSAKFAFMNTIGSGTPTASISGTTAGVNTYLDGNGNLGTTKAKTLTLGTSSTGNVSLAPGGSTALTALANGFVGIGTTAPSTTLTVNGTSNLDYFLNPNEYGISTGGGINFTQWNNSTIPYVLFNINDLNAGYAFKTNNGSRDVLDMESDGRIEIGKAIGGTLGQGTLDVRSVTGTIPVATFSGSTSFASMLVDQSGNGDIFAASKSGATKFVITNSGNVGIGTSQPASVLDVTSQNSNGLRVYSPDRSKYVQLAWDGSNVALNPQGTQSQIILGSTYLTSTVTFGALSTNGGVLYTDSSGTLNQATSTQLVVGGTGNIGIGTSSPNFKLDVQDSQSATSAAQIVNTDTGTNADGLIVKLGNTSTSTVSTTNHFINFETAGIGVVGSIQGNGGKNVAFKTNGVADFAEYVKKSDAETFNYGDVICIASDGKATKCNAGSTQVLGVMSDTFTVIGGDETDAIPVGIRGFVYTNVSAANGPIAVGDTVTASNIPGVAVKATQAGEVLGRAVEAYSGNGVTRIKVMVNPGWFDPTIAFTEAGNLNTFQAVALPDNANPVYALKNTQTGATVAKKDAFSDLAAGNVKAGGIDAQKLILAGRDVASRLDALESTASASAQLQNKVSQIDHSVQSLSDRVASLESQISLMASGSALLSSPVGFQASSAASLGLDSLDVKSATVTKDLSVLGRTTVADLGVTGRVTIGLLGINGLDEDASGGGQAFASINTSAGPLKFQPEALNGVDFFDGKVTFETNGNITTAGAVTAKKFNVDTQDVASATLGQGVMKAGQSKVVIQTKSVTDKSAIFVTAKSKTSLPLSVTTQDAGKSFTVEMASPATADVPFSWWIVN